jgi:hypothetical protein
MGQVGTYSTAVDQSVNTGVRPEPAIDIAA